MTPNLIRLAPEEVHITLCSVWCYTVTDLPIPYHFIIFLYEIFCHDKANYHIFSRMYVSHRCKLSYISVRESHGNPVILSNMKISKMKSLCGLDFPWWDDAIDDVLLKMKWESKYWWLDHYICYILYADIYSIWWAGIWSGWTMGDVMKK